jgi:hypothetical protein
MFDINDNIIDKEESGWEKAVAMKAAEVQNMASHVLRISHLCCGWQGPRGQLLNRPRNSGEASRGDKALLSVPASQHGKPYEMQGFASGNALQRFGFENSCTFRCIAQPRCSRAAAAQKSMLSGAPC